MPSTGNGIGTTFYGRFDEADDGSYVTTVWVVFLFLPIFPLRAERILLLSEFDNGGGQIQRRYSVLGRVTLNRREVAKTYVVGWSILAWYVSLLYLFEYVAPLFGRGNGPFVVMGWFTLPFAILFAWQKWFRAPPKLRPVEVMPGSEFSVYRKTDEKKG